MILCGGDIVTIIILVLSIVVAISKKKEPAKHIATRSYDYDAEPEPDASQDRRKEDAPHQETVADVGKDVGDYAVTREKQRSGTAIDKKKLIIYSEIMKPKFDE